MGKFEGRPEIVPEMLKGASGVAFKLLTLPACLCAIVVRLFSLLACVSRGYLMAFLQIVLCDHVYFIYSVSLV